jgi:DNA-binding NarL/FixJ family response regulator
MINFWRSTAARALDNGRFAGRTLRINPLEYPMTFYCHNPKDGKVNKSYEVPGAHSADEHPAQRQEIVVLLVDKRAWTREALARTLEAVCRDFRVRCFESASDLEHAAPAPGQRVILLNLNGIALADCGVTTAVATARSCLPDVPVVAIADSVDAEDILSAVERGLRGYIPNTLEFQLVVEGLRFVTAGGTFVPAEPLLASFDATPCHTVPPPQSGEAAVSEPVNSPAPAISITPREGAVLDGLRQGMSNKQIARELGLREPTIKIHIRHTMRKFGVTNRTQVALLAERLRPSDDHT